MKRNATVTTMLSNLKGVKANDLAKVTLPYGVATVNAKALGELLKLSEGDLSLDIQTGVERTYWDSRKISIKLVDVTESAMLIVKFDGITSRLRHVEPAKGHTVIDVMSEAVKPASVSKRQRIEIITKDGVAVPLFATVFDGVLAVHRSITDTNRPDGERWVITHIPTSKIVSMATCFKTPSAQDVKEFATMLVESDVWRFVVPTDEALSWHDECVKRWELAHDIHHVSIKAKYDDDGNCTVCGESGRCPGWHSREEVKATRSVSVAIMA